MELSFNDVDWRSLLLKRYKGLGLTENDVMVVLMADQVIRLEGAIPLSGNNLTQYMALSDEQIDHSLMSLVDKKLLAFEGPNSTLSLNPLFEKLFSDFKKDIVLSTDSRSKKKVDETYAFFQKELGRPISPLEVDKINSWIGEGATVGMMQEAFYNVQQKDKRVTFNRLGKEVLRLLQEKDIGKEGYTARDEGHRKNDLGDALSHNWLVDD